MIKDSGERTEFSTGAVRDMKRGVGRMDLLPWYGIMEVSKHCEEGAEKYGEHNVDKGIPLHSLCDSAARHLAKFIAGEMDEDHLRAAAWNLLWALNQRKTHPELDDLYSHKETVEKVRNLVDEFNKAKANGEVVFEDGPDTINEECETDTRPLTRDEILQRCRDGQDVYVVSIFEGPRIGWCYLSFALPNNEEDPLSVFMYPVEGEGHKPFLYAPDKFEVYDAVPCPFVEKESSKGTEEDPVKVKEPTAIEPLSKELLLGMNGRFVYLMQSVSFWRLKEDMSDYVELGWVRVKVVEDDIFIVVEDDNQNVVSEVKFDPSWMRCYVTNPLTKKKE